MQTYPNHRKYLTYAVNKRLDLIQSFSGSELELLRDDLARMATPDVQPLEAFYNWRNKHNKQICDALSLGTSPALLQTDEETQRLLRLGLIHLLSEALSLLNPLINSQLLECEDDRPAQIIEWHNVQQQCQDTYDVLWPFDEPCPFY